ncbi:MAG: phosphoribosylformylglycinamidine synthase subunit PurS [Peptococcaceae bacterium]|jgi:phosphoribosylformylglycinamidine synthase PurS subunit|nr:phosphoribosylformylglycinamidine synthase subunit PurS [Peptococcaceae bacterium]MDH7526411.1 phosphoribosylformylglycinamidine synthase subunit PurS [Peptococcaceae bacterium]
MFKAVVTVTFKKSILDPQGSAVLKALKSLGFQGVEDVRVGKHIEVLLQSESQEKAKYEIETMCSKLLANPVIEDYYFEVAEVE